MSQGLFCYKVMPFELKNVGATYQILVNKMFIQQIGWNVEADWSPSRVSRPTPKRSKPY